MTLDTSTRPPEFASAPGTAAGEAAPAPRDTARLIRSEQLFDGANEVLVEHSGAVYRLRRTALGKLILTK